MLLVSAIGGAPPMTRKHSRILDLERARDLNCSGCMTALPRPSPGTVSASGSGTHTAARAAHAPVVVIERDARTRGTIASALGDFRIHEADIVLTPRGDAQQAIRALQIGARACIDLPVDPARLRVLVAKDAPPAGDP